MATKGKSKVVSDSAENARALFKAIASGKVRMVVSLLEAGCDVNVTDENQQSPLTRAIFLSREDVRGTIIRQLLLHNPDVNLQDNTGRTALMHACFELDREDVVRLLIRTGRCDPNMTDENGNNCLFHAIWSGNFPAIRILVNSTFTKHILDVNSTNYDGVTPIALAWRLKQHECCKVLVNEGGVDISNIKEKERLKKVLVPEVCTAQPKITDKSFTKTSSNSSLQFDKISLDSQNEVIENSVAADERHKEKASKYWSFFSKSIKKKKNRHSFENKVGILPAKKGNRQLPVTGSARMYMVDDSPSQSSFEEDTSVPGFGTSARSCDMVFKKNTSITNSPEIIYESKLAFPTSDIMKPQERDQTKLRMDASTMETNTRLKAVYHSRYKSPDGRRRSDTTSLTPVEGCISPVKGSISPEKGFTSVKQLPSPMLEPLGQTLHLSVKQDISYASIKKPHSLANRSTHKPYESMDSSTLGPPSLRVDPKESMAFPRSGSMGECDLRWGRRCVKKQCQLDSMEGCNAFRKSPSPAPTPTGGMRKLSITQDIGSASLKPSDIVDRSRRFSDSANPFTLRPPSPRLDPTGNRPSPSGSLDHFERKQTRMYGKQEQSENIVTDDLKLSGIHKSKSSSTLPALNNRKHSLVTTPDLPEYINNSFIRT